jgi:glycosyltransferase involved in cell wall biosynthesis
MKLILLSLEWPRDQHIGGVGRYAFRIASELRHSVDLTVVTIAGGTPLEGARMVYLPRPKGRIARYYLTPLRLRRLMASMKADVIHAFGDDWALSPSNTPVVRTFLGSSLAEAKASRGLRSLNHYVLALTEARSRALASFRIAIGPDSMEAFNCDILMPPVTEVPAAHGITKTAYPSVVFIGSYNGRKRGWLVSKTVNQARAATGLPITLTVIGPSSDQASWPAGTLHLADASDELVRETIASSWVLMAPSEYEGFGIPLYEAMSLGTYGIATPNPGSSYIADSVLPSPPITLAEDADLSLHLEARLLKSPPMSAQENADANGAVEYLLREGSASRLLNIYRTLIR